jgi:IS1 family transposase
VVLTHSAASVGGLVGKPFGRPTRVHDLGTSLDKGSAAAPHRLRGPLRVEARAGTIQCDEIWSFVKVKQGHIKPGTDRTKIGDQWTFVAIDADTKLVPSHLVGKRTRANAITFMNDLSGRLSNRVQISTDALRSYVDAIEESFGADVDYGQIVKFYDAEPIGAGRYSPPQVTGAVRTVITGAPDQAHISTSFVERQNLTMRMRHAPTDAPDQCFQQEV